MPATVNRLEAFLESFFTLLRRWWMRADGAKWIMPSVARSVVQMCAGNVSIADLIVHMPLLPHHNES